MKMKLTEEQLMKAFSQGRIELDGSEVIEFPDVIYKKVSGELNAEKTMFIVLKARSDRRTNPPKPIKVHPVSEAVGGTI